MANRSAIHDNPQPRRAAGAQIDNEAIPPLAYKFDAKAGGGCDGAKLALLALAENHRTGVRRAGYQGLIRCRNTAQLRSSI
jgi:hypothetical protein